MNEKILELKQVVLHKGAFKLGPITMDIHRGEIVSIIGKTGAGKTLLLETIAGFCRPDSGNVLYCGKNMHEIPVHRRNVGYLYQEYGLFPHMTVEANIGYGLRQKKNPKSYIRRQVTQIAEKFEITNILHQYPGTLSGGEQQRAALARTLILKPSLLLLDEPFSALDPVTRQQFYKLLLDIQKDYLCAVILVTHDFSEARRLSSRIGILMNGRLRGIVNKEELYTFPWDNDVGDFLGI